MPTVTAGQSTVVQLSGTEAIWVNSTGVGVAEFECGSPQRLNLTSEYQRIGFFGADSCIELRSVSGQINYQSSPPAIYPLTAVAMGDRQNSSPVDIALTVSALVGQPSQRGILCAAIGDSRLANSFQNQDTGGWTRNYSTNQGVIGWLSFFLNQRINLPYNYDLAVSGSGCAAIRASVSQVLLLNPKPAICLINGGTNDFAVVGDLARAQQAFSDISAAAIQLRQNGIVPVIEIDMPRATSSWSANAGTVSSAFNQMLREWCRPTGVLLVDYEYQYIQIDGNPVAAYNVADGIHQSCTGAVIRALKYAEVIEPLLPEFTTNTGSVRDAFGSTLNPKGNLITSIGFMTGTGGANMGTGASGSVSTGWLSRVISGTMTAVASKESPRTDGRLGDRLVVALSATNASEYRLAPQNNPVTTGNYPAGTLVYAECDLEITALAGTIDYIRLVLSDFDGATEGSRSYAMKDVFATGLNPVPLVPLTNNTGSGNAATTLKGRLRTELVIVGQALASTQLIYRIEVKLAAGASCTFKFGDATIRAV
jgi:hypothetical protein